ncbi:MAG: DUF2855 family protein [Alphaproteobacteria bacterium]|nr:DUF2855 family protein [Alphaproteobacteria bacterium]
MNIEQVEVRRKAFAETRITSHSAPDLGEGEVLARIERFAITANNVSYALSGDMIGYWKFFPVEEPWGMVPVWGFAEIVKSRCEDMPVGERIWGFLPMASHIVLKPTQITAGSFADGADHRASLPAIYNDYQRTKDDPPHLQALANERCILFPLFTTSFILADFLADNAHFGARQILIGSASSKTGLGLCNLLMRLGGERPRVTGLTSPRNLEFVRKLGVCDAVKTYELVDTLDASSETAFVDMAGNAEVTRAIHRHFGPNLKFSTGVGATHWDAPRFRGEGAVVAHNFFFAPAQFMKREQEWGHGELLRRAMHEAARISLELRDLMHIRQVSGASAVAEAFAQAVHNETPANVGIIASVNM